MINDTVKKKKEKSKYRKSKSAQCDKRNNINFSSTSCTLSTFICETICIGVGTGNRAFFSFFLFLGRSVLFSALVDGDWISARLEFWCFGEMCKVVARIPRQNCNWLECAVIGLFKAWNLIKILYFYQYPFWNDAI